MFATNNIDGTDKADVLKRVQLCFKANGSRLQSARISKSQDEKFLIWTFQCDIDSDFNNIVNYIKNNVEIPVVRLESNKSSDAEIADKLKNVKLRGNFAIDRPN